MQTLFKLWIQYIRYIIIVELFIAAERTGNRQNHLGNTDKMFYLFAAMGVLNSQLCQVTKPMYK